MQLSRKIVLLAALAMSGALTVALAADASSFYAISGRYESIRQALLHDTAEGVAQHAQSIRQLAATLE